MKLVIAIIIIILTCLMCSNSNKDIAIPPNDNTNIICDSKGCEGKYQGPEFVNGADIAHQFSNTMSARVGDQLKKLYDKGEYSKVDLTNIMMSTNGMGSGIVTYTVSIPFLLVKEKCEAYTSFDHVGGWNHEPALAARKKQLNKALMDGHQLDISKLKTTPEGLQEYWIQWKNNVKQADCQDYEPKN